MIKFFTTVKKIEHKSRVARAWKTGIGDEVQTETQDLGWAVLLEGSWEWLFVGSGEPDLKVGDEVEVIIQRRTG